MILINQNIKKTAKDSKTAVIQEGLKFVYGAEHRLQRVAPNNVLQYKNRPIPPGTSTSMTTSHIHNNPERRIKNPRLDKQISLVLHQRITRYPSINGPHERSKLIKKE